MTRPAKLIICGRTCSGKSLLADMLSEKGMYVAHSYTNRPKRFPDESSYHFITDEEYAEMCKTPENILLPTEHNGYAYFLTREEIERADVLIIDKSGIDDITALFPDFTFRVIYVHGLNEEQRKCAYLNRTDDPAKKIEFENKFNERMLGEDDQFTQLEDIFIRHTANLDYENIYLAKLVSNDYTPNSDIFAAAEAIFAEWKQSVRVCRIIDAVIAHDAEHPSFLDSLGFEYNRDENKFVLVCKTPNQEHITKQVSPEHIAEIMTMDREPFFRIVGAWLFITDELPLF